MPTADDERPIRLVGEDQLSDSPNGDRIDAAQNDGQDHCRRQGRLEHLQYRLNIHTLSLIAQKMSLDSNFLPSVLRLLPPVACRLTPQASFNMETSRSISLIPTNGAMMPPSP